MPTIPGALKRVLPPGMQVTRLGDDAWLLRRGAAVRSLAVDEVDDATWVVRRRGRRGRVVRRLGPERLTYERAGFELAGIYPVIMDRPTLRAVEFDALLVRAGAVRKH